MRKKKLKARLEKARRKIFHLDQRLKYFKKLSYMEEAEANGETTRRQMLENDISEMARQSGNVGLLRRDIETIAANRDIIATMLSEVTLENDRLKKIIADSAMK